MIKKFKQFLLENIPNDDDDFSGRDSKISTTSYIEEYKRLPNRKPIRIYDDIEEKQSNANGKYIMVYSEATIVIEVGINYTFIGYKIGNEFKPTDKISDTNLINLITRAEKIVNNIGLPEPEKFTVYADNTLTKPVPFNSTNARFIVYKFGDYAILINKINDTFYFNGYYDLYYVYVRISESIHNTDLNQLLIDIIAYIKSIDHITIVLPIYDNVNFIKPMTLDKCKNIHTIYIKYEFKLYRNTYKAVIRRQPDGYDFYGYYDFDNKLYYIDKRSNDLFPKKNASIYLDNIINQIDKYQV